MVSRTLFTYNLLKTLALPGACRQQMLQLGKTYQNRLWCVTTFDNVTRLVLHDIIKHSAKIILRLRRGNSFYSHSDFPMKFR